MEHLNKHTTAFHKGEKSTPLETDLTNERQSEFLGFESISNENEKFVLDLKRNDEETEQYNTNVQFVIKFLAKIIQIMF